MKFSDNVGEPSYLPKSLSIVYIVFRSEDKFLAPNFSGRTTPTFLRRTFSAFLLSAVWQCLVDRVPFADLRLRSLATKRKQNLGLRVGVKNSGPILSRLWTEVREIFRRCIEDPRTFQRPYRLSISYFVQKTFAINPRSRRKTEQMYNVLPPMLTQS